MKKLFSFVCALICAMSLSAQTYYIAGNEAALFAKSWDPAGMALEQQTDGTWSKTFTTCGIGTEYQFKVTDGTWTNKWGYNELTTVPEGVTTLTEGTGENNIICTTYDANMTVVFDPATKKITLTGVFQGTAEPQPLTYFLLHGNFTGSWENTNEFAISADGATATLTLTLEAGDYEFGARIKSESNWSSTGETITRASNTADFNKKGGNNKMTADVAGEYVFTYTAATKILSVTYPASTGGEGGGTDPDVPTLPKIQLMGDLTNWDNGTEMTPSMDNLTAELSLELIAEKTYELKIKKNGSWLGNNGKMTADNCSGWTFEGNKGNCKLTTTVAGSYTFKWEYATDKLTVTYPSSTPTALSNTEVENAAVKVIRNGQVLIVREGVTYNMMGQVIQ